MMYTALPPALPGPLVAARIPASSGPLVAARTRVSSRPPTAYRRFRVGCGSVLLLVLWSTQVVGAQSPESRIEGLLVGSLIGDAMGAPLEFASRNRAPLDTLSRAAVEELRTTFGIPASRRPPDPYGPWSMRPGALTDDSRFKVILFDHLRRDHAPSREGFARSIVRWYEDPEAPDPELRRAWLEEFVGPARWVLGDSVLGLPPERSWGGVPTMAGQMPFLPLAALTSSADQAYRLVWDLDLLDNGTARDINAAVVAGLHAALQPNADWTTIEASMRATDPYRFGEVPWVPRAVDEWLDLSAELADRAAGSPETLYQLLEENLQARTWWEAWVPVVVVFSAARLASFDPLATMQLILTFGHDTDSYLQLAGAFFGALHGSEVFPRTTRLLVERSLTEEYGHSLADWVALLLAHPLR